MVSGDYVIEVAGEIGDDLWPAFEPCTVSVAHGRTTIHADGVDQAALHGILDVARSFGLDLIGIHLIDGGG